MVSRSRSKIGSAVAQVLIYVALGVISIFMLLPFVWMVSTSLKVDAEIFSREITWIPSQLDWENYTYIFNDLSMEVLFRNTIFVTLIAVVAQIVLCSMAGLRLCAVALSRPRRCSSSPCSSR